MKKTATLTILAATVMMAALSCTKELNGVVDKSGDTMSLTVSATLPDYADATKNTLVNTVRVKWETGDEVYVYDNVKCLGTLTATVSDDQGKTALLSGEISTSSASKLTLVAMTDDITPSVSEQNATISGGITFDLPGQSLADAPYVAYATVDTQSETVSNLSVAFSFATSVERVNCTGLKAGTAIDSVIITGVNTQLKITPSESGNPDVAAETGEGTIIRKNADGFTKEKVNANGVATFSVALLEQAANDRKIEVFQSNWPSEAKFTNGNALDKGLSYNTVCQLSSDYVLIKAKYNDTDSTTLKWYKQNLAITASGKKAWKGTNTSAVKVPGTNSEEVIVGDYFQWAASYKGYNVKAGNEKLDSLLIYTAFTNKGCGESDNKFTFRSPETDKTYHFNTSNSGSYIGISPHWSGSAYDKYNTSDALSILERTETNNNDVANIILGGTWRMPTKDELQAMKDATYWAWDAEDQGYYVYAPASGDEGGLNGKQSDGVTSVSDTYTKSAALLFFPAAGSGYSTSLGDAGSRGYYWSSSLNTGNTDTAYYLNFYSDTVNPQDSYSRYFGFSVRPVSDL